MEYEETRKILTRLKAVYPAAMRKLSKADGQAMLDEWAKAFKNDCAEAVNDAVTKHISAVPFLPSISDIRVLMPKRAEYDTDAAERRKECRRSLVDIRRIWAKELKNADTDEREQKCREMIEKIDGLLAQQDGT